MSLTKTQEKELHADADKVIEDSEAILKKHNRVDLWWNSGFLAFEVALIIWGVISQNWELVGIAVIVSLWMIVMWLKDWEINNLKNIIRIQRGISELETKWMKKVDKEKSNASTNTK